MKRAIIIVLTGVLTISSCISDQGNYDYREINEITISGIAEGYSVNMELEELEITPEVTMSLYSGNPDNDRFKYEWLLYNGNDCDTISNTRTLKTKFNYSPAIYTVYFKVVDKETGIKWKAKTLVSVGTPYTKGFMVLGENPDTRIVELEMISMSGIDTTLYGDVLKNSGLPELRNPIKVLHTGKSTVNPKLWVMTGSGSYYLDLLTMKSNTSKNFESIKLIPDTTGIEEYVVEQFPHICAYDGATAYDYYRGYITNKGNVYYTAPLFMGDFYDYPHNCTIKFTDPAAVFYKAAPYAMHFIKSSLSGLIWYDRDNDRFLSDTSPVGDKSTILTDKDGDPFPWNNRQINRTLLYGENTFNTDGGSTNGNSYAVMKSNINGNGYIYKFYAKSTPEKRNCYEVLNSVAPDFTKANQYAFSSLRTVVLYTYSGKLYAYNFNPGYERNFDLSAYVGEDEVTMVMFDTQSQPTKDYLYIATFNSKTGGRIRKFAIGSNLNSIELVAMPEFDYGGLCKIKHMSWRGGK